MSPAALFLRSISYQAPDEATYYPFALPPITTLSTLEFHAPVTFFAGENGTGKSTLLEAIAAAAHSITVRGDDALTQETLSDSHKLADCLRLRWSAKTRHGFFLRAEDFFDFSKRLTSLAMEMHGTGEEFEARFEGYGRDLARGVAYGQERAILERYGGDLNARSHGESFLQFFASRFSGAGLYLLDEPDTALSAQSVLGLIAMIKRMVAEGAQFIIATHSPILLAFPGAAIFSFDRTPIAEVVYDDLEGIALLRDFMAHRQAYLRHL